MNEPRILIVEDEHIVAADLRERLTRMGYQPVGQATRADQAVALAGTLRPDLVLMDIRLEGGTDGVTAASDIREQFQIPSVFLSAYSEDATIDRAKSAEPFGYVLKPVDDRELKVHIEMALHRHRTERALQDKNLELERALAQVKKLSGLLPICASCKNIRDDTGYWSRVESYISTHSEAVFSHGLCPDCARKLFPDIDLE